MSNIHVGAVFAKVIEEVIESCHNDFEEGGVEPGTLEELKKAWQKRVSEHKVAHMPWDPQPPPMAPAHHPSPVPSNVPVKAEPQQYAPPVMAGSTAQSNIQQRTKQDAGYDANIAAVPPYMNGGYNPGLNPQQAQQRAAMLLQQRYGEQANNSIASMQPQAGLGTSIQQRTQSHQTDQSQQQQRAQYHAYQQQQAEQSEQQRRQTVGAAQTDGAGDAPDSQWSAVLMQRTAVGNEQRRKADGMLRRHVEQTAQRMEGGGLLVPLDERYGNSGRKRKAVTEAVAIHKSSSLPILSSYPVSQNTSTAASISQYDGPASDDDGLGVKDGERDEDAINSDLDDSDEDELARGEGEDGMFTGDTMMCTYDKVQRVKNKWKCTLKDGILSADGKEYIFHKAQGEFEW